MNIKESALGSNNLQHTVDLTNCDREPIHIIGQIQPYGCLMIIDPQRWTIQQVSLNISTVFGASGREMIGAALTDYLPKEIAQKLQSCPEKDPHFEEFNPCLVALPNGKAYHLTAHIHEQHLLLEWEPLPQEKNSMVEFSLLGRVINRIQSAKTVQDCLWASAKEVKRLTGFDRVMIYRFDPQWNGEVVAEEREPHLEPYLGLHYPPSDIPRQARKLFTQKHVRLIADVNATPVALYPSINPITNEPPDLTHSTLRTPSPMHIEYLQNMGVSSTLTISIIFQEKLWGLIACHHYAPRIVDYSLREACRYIGQLISGYLSFKSADESILLTQQQVQMKTEFLNELGLEWDITKMADKHPHLLSFAEASGAVIHWENKWVLVGRTPAQDDLIALFNWMRAQAPEGHFFQTHQLPALFPEAMRYKHLAAGAIGIWWDDEANNFMMWFRPEVLQEVSWAGNPEKPVEVIGEEVRLSPRKSFEKWVQTIENTALPWKKSEIFHIEDTQKVVGRMMLKRFNQLAQLNQQLKQANENLRAFSHSVSHDLRAPLRHIEGFSSILSNELKGKADDHALELLGRIRNGAVKMSAMIEHILWYSKISYQEHIFQPFDLGNLFAAVAAELTENNQKYTQLQLNIQPTGLVLGDEKIMWHVAHNLLSNAFKYTHGHGTRIEIGKTGTEEGLGVFYIKDDGIGFDPRGAQNIYKLFTRLVSQQKYEGSGVGLSIAKMIIERHGGRIWHESTLNVGTTFYFTLPTIDS